jgi:predicted AlkP superfamily pyrophosphatase or phosphodiesterase
VISIDGLGWAAYRRHRAHAKHLLAIERRGTAYPMRVVFPSVTWSSHASLLTGQYPRHHGFLGNRWFVHPKVKRPYLAVDVDRARRKRTWALQELIAKKGGRVAALNWPATQGAKTIRYNLAEFMGTSRLPYQTMSRPLWQLIKKRYRGIAGQPKRHRRYLGRLVGRILQKESLESDLLVRDLAIALTKKKRVPELMLVHFLLLDTWLHRYGNAHWIERWAIKTLDRFVGQLLAAYRRAGLADKTAVIVVSDHGFAEISHWVDLRQLVADAGVDISRRAKGKLADRKLVMVDNGHAAYVYLAQKQMLSDVKKALTSSIAKPCIERVLLPTDYRRLGLPHGRPAATDARGSQRPEPGIHEGTPDLIALAHPHCSFHTTAKGKPIRDLKSFRFGHHGYLPNHPALKGIFLASGIGIKNGACKADRSISSTWRRPSRGFWGWIGQKRFPKASVASCSTVAFKRGHAVGFARADGNCSGV